MKGAQLTLPSFDLTRQILGALSLACLSLSVSAASTQRAPHINVELISLHDALSPGQSSTVALRFVPDPGWHVYWHNPGDTGLAPNVTWQTEEALQINALKWGFPEAIPVAHLVNYGFHELILPADMQLAETSDASKITVKAKTDWLVCKESCIPGEAELELSIPVAKDLTEASINQENQLLLSNWDKYLPEAMTPLGAKANIENAHLKLDVFADKLIFADAENVEVFIENLDLVSYQSPIEVKWKRNRLQWTQKLNDYYSKKPEQLSAVIVVDRRKAYRIEIAL